MVSRTEPNSRGFFTETGFAGRAAFYPGGRTKAAAGLGLGLVVHALSILARIEFPYSPAEILGEIILMAYVIAEPCIGTKDHACVDACPVDCIHPKKDNEKFATEEMLYIDPVECIDCGACVPVCPVSAIFALDDLPEKWKSYAERNAKYFGR